MALFLGLSADNLGDQLVEIDLVHAVITGCLLIVDARAIQFLEAEQIWLNPLCLWSFNLNLGLLFAHIFVAIFLCDLCVLVCGIVALDRSIKLNLNEFGSVLILRALNGL